MRLHKEPKISVSAHVHVLLVPDPLRNSTFTWCVFEPVQTGSKELDGSGDALGFGSLGSDVIILVALHVTHSCGELDMLQTDSKELDGSGEARDEDPASSLVSDVMMLVACSWEFTAAIHCINGAASHLLSELSTRVQSNLDNRNDLTRKKVVPVLMTFLLEGF